ncbi:MAG: prephenate dehydrogenase [Clostridia bacterium]|nr:prephenate dehydrogenase [Clostridia bacterium]
MTAGIVGLGLIGGSFAKAYKAAGHRVLAANRTGSVLKYALLSGDVDAELTADNIDSCDILILCLYPEAVTEYLREHAGRISEGTLVIDTCGTKRAVVESCMALAEQYGFTFVGGHPMAGTQFSGYKYSRANLFSGAAMVIVPPDFGDIALLSRVKELLAPAGFGSIHVTTAEEHDRAIAFTSQLTHLVSNAYVKSHTAGQLKGFTGGSYRDMTRVAWLNPEMWAELFLENADNLSAELSGLIAELEKYRAAIDSGDRETLTALLAEGRRIKEEAENK